MARKTLNDRQITALKPAKKRQQIPDPLLPAHYVAIEPTGVKSFKCVSRDPGGKQKWYVIGRCDRMSIADSRELAKVAMTRIKQGLPPTEAPAAPQETFGDATETWLRRHVEVKGLLSAVEIKRILTVYVLPAWQGRPAASIRRGDATLLIDHIEDAHGLRQADYARAIIQAILNFHAGRTDDYAAPTIKRRYIPSEHRRERILTDDELRAVWAACSATYGAIIKTALLTGQRREKVVSMRWTDIDGGTWTMPTTSDRRAKGVGAVLGLPQLVLDVINAQPQVSEYVFAGRGSEPFNAWSQAKRRLDAASGVTGWTVHDLRRTARSLMGQAGVRPDIAERVLGHAQPVIVGTYDLHKYTAEKADALAKLAGLIDRILHPAENVVALRG